jgi:hypothetical protein
MSYSQLQVYDCCEYSWYLNYDQGWTTKSTGSALNIGSLIHELLEIHYNLVMNGNMDTEPVIDERLKDLVAEAMDSTLNQSSTLSEIYRAGNVVKRYINEFAPLKDVGIQIMGVEHHFEVPIVTPRGFHFILQGYIDLLISLQGKVWVWDHKSTSNAAFWKPGEVQMDPQMTLYQYALKLMGIPVHGIIYNFFNTYEYKKPVETAKLFKREPSYRSDIEVKNFARELLVQVEKVITNSSDPTYPYHRSLRRDCDKCKFKEPCLYALKGIDPQPILVTKFMKKER